MYSEKHKPLRRGSLTTDGRVTTPYHPANLPLLRSMPGARWDPEARCWWVSVAQKDRRRLLEVADQLGLEVAPSLRDQGVSEAARRAWAAGLYPFQVEGVDWLAGRPRALLADEMGLGKSAQALLALPEGAAALVVCPASLKYTWREEARRWRPDLQPAVLEGKGAFHLPRPGEVVVANYEILPASLEGGVGVAQGFQTEAAGVHLIVDEAHKVKNHKAARTRRVRGLAGQTRTAWGLTGTPLLNRPPDLWGVLDCLGLAREAFGSWPRFCRLFGVRENFWGGLEWGEPAPEVSGLLRRVMLRRRRQEVLPQLPAKQYRTVVVTLDQLLGRDLDGLWKDWEPWMTERGELPPFDHFSTVREHLARARIPAMLELVEEYEEQGVPLVVFSAHRAPVEALRGRKGWGVITGEMPPAERQAAVEAFQAGRLKGVGLTIQAGGTGLTLTRAWTALFVDQDWAPANNAQAEDRLARIGQQASKVLIIRLVSDHALDRRVLQILDRKQGLIQKAVEGPTRPAAGLVPG
jgi:SWI/SNF-related matrix-associated actin-dependent regulator of chromatin subfamily A-like protein 1